MIRLFDLLLCQQDPFNKRIDVTVKNTIYIPNIHIDAVVLNHLIGMQNV